MYHINCILGILQLSCRYMAHYKYIIAIGIAIARFEYMSSEAHPQSLSLTLYNISMAPTSMSEILSRMIAFIYVH